MSNTSFGRRLATLRRRRGWSQRRLAELLCAASGVTTVSRNEVSRWERGLRTPTAPWLAWLAQVLQEPMPIAPVPADAPTVGAGHAQSCRWRAQRRPARHDDRRRPAEP